MGRAPILGGYPAARIARIAARLSRNGRPELHYARPSWRRVTRPQGEAAQGRSLTRAVESTAARRLKERRYSHKR